MNFNEDEAVIAKKFDPNQVWRSIVASTRSKSQATNDQQKIDKVQQPIVKLQKQVDKGKQQQVNASNTKLGPSNVQKTQYVPRGQQGQTQRMILQPSQ